MKTSNTILKRLHELTPMEKTYLRAVLASQRGSRNTARDKGWVPASEFAAGTDIPGVENSLNLLTAKGFLEKTHSVKGMFFQQWRYRVPLPDGVELPKGDARNGSVSEELNELPNLSRFMNR